MDLRYIVAVELRGWTGYRGSSLRNQESCGPASWAGQTAGAVRGGEGREAKRSLCSVRAKLELPVGHARAQRAGSWRDLEFMGEVKAVGTN